MSTFGGPHDTGVAPDEGLALIDAGDLAEWWFKRIFLACQPVNTTGLARRLDPDAFYLAMRWGDHGIAREVARRAMFRLTVPGDKGGRSTVFAQGADFGPALWTHRVADVSPGVARVLDIATDNEVTVEMITA